MKSTRFKFTAAVVLILVTALFGWEVFNRINEDADKSKRSRKSRPVPVEVAEIQHGSIELKRTFSGALEAPAKFNVAPKVSGRIVRLGVDLSDTVSRGQVVAELDSDEYVQAVEQAKADVAVAKANLGEAKSILQIAARETKRIEALLEKNIAHESQHDKAKSKELEKRARVEVTEAQLLRAAAALETANIRLGYTKVTADWTGGGTQRVVAERYVNEGDTVSASSPIVQIVELNPIIGVFFVTEKDYARLKTGQAATLSTDAYPDESFKGSIERIAPVFRQSTRQARVELTVENPQRRLKPGMFIRIRVILGRTRDATIVPDQALTTRNDVQGVFVLNEGGKTVSWREVKVGIRESGWAEVEGEKLNGWVVTLGQHFLDDGSSISVAAMETKAISGEKKKENQ